MINEKISIFINRLAINHDGYARFLMEVKHQIEDMSEAQTIDHLDSLCNDAAKFHRRAAILAERVERKHGVFSGPIHDLKDATKELYSLMLVLRSGVISLLVA